MLDPNALGAQIYFKDGRHTDFAKKAIRGIKQQIKQLEKNEQQQNIR